MRRPSQRDIAERAHVSQTVVSMVLNGKTAEHGIAKATERKVRAAIEELDYVPNISARSLRSGRNGLIGVHTFETLFPTSQHSYYFEFMVGVEEKAMETGQDLVLLTSAHQRAGQQSIYRGGNNRLRLTDGAIILGFHQDDDELSRLADEGFPFVFIGRRERVSSLMPYITPDYRQASADMITQVAGAGHRRISYVGLAQRAEPRRERLDTVRQVAHQLDISIHAETFCQPGSLEVSWLTTLHEDGVTAIVVEGCDHLPQLAGLCEASGVAIPRDLSVVCLDTSDSDGEASRYDWCHTVIPRREIGARAVGILLKLLDHQRSFDYREEVPCAVHRGKTLARPRDVAPKGHQP